MDYITISGSRKWAHRCSACNKNISTNEIMVETMFYYHNGGEVNFYHCDCVPDFINNATEHEKCRIIYWEKD